MRAKICCLCQDNLALEPALQKAYFGRTFFDEEGESPCMECIQEMQENDEESLEAE